jgi:hypothetical protein
VVAQFKVNGVAAVLDGLKFPIAKGYVTVGGVAGEVAIGTVVVGGVSYAIYVTIK